MDNPFVQHKKFWITLASIFVILIISFFVYQHKSQISSKLDFNVYTTSFIELNDTALWHPTLVDEEGFGLVIENSQYALYMKPETGEISLKDKAQVFTWRSNPSKEQMENETVTGLFRSNLQSSFILEYFEEGGIQRKVKNAIDNHLEKNIYIIEDGVQINYEFTDIGISFSVQYELTDNGLRASIPAEGIREEEDNKIIAIDLLPFFGAASKDGQSGYMFVPDGVGAIINFPQTRELIGRGYSQYVYGNEITNRTSSSDLIPISYPVFGMKQGDNGYAAIIKKGEYAARINAYPSGVVSTFNSTNARFTYRFEYDRRLSLGGTSVRVFQDDMLKQDAVVEYYFLSEDQANYVGMANVYRDYLIETGQMKDDLRPVEHIPLDLAIIGGDGRTIGADRFEVTTTFSQAEEIISDLKSSGIHHIDLTFHGWQKKGNNATTKEFSLESSLGSMREFSSLINMTHDLGYTFKLNVDLITGNPEYLKLTPRNVGIRSAEGDVLLSSSYAENFYLNPNISYNLNQKLIEKLSDLNVDGIQYTKIGELVFRDYNPKYMYQREQTAEIFQHMLAKARSALGYSSVENGNAYVLKHTDHVQFPSNLTNNFYVLDETVPFYPIVLRGKVSYSMVHANLRSDYDEGLLKALEYGAIPSFVLTHSSSRELMDTSIRGVFSSSYNNWKDKLLAEYEIFDQLASTFHLQIINHAKIAQGVYETEYENGVKVIVDYNTNSFQIEGREG